MALPVGARYVYTALGLEQPEEGNEEEDAFPPSAFADELEDAAIFLMGLYPKAQYPCLYQGDTLNPALPNDARMVARAIGYYTAFLLVGGNPSAPGVGGPIMTKRKLLDVEYTFKEIDPAQRTKDFYDMSIAAMEATSCVLADSTGANGFEGGGLLRVVNPNRDSCGRLFLDRRYL